MIPSSTFSISGSSHPSLLFATSRVVASSSTSSLAYSAIGETIVDSGGGGGSWKALMVTTLFRGGELFMKQQNEHLDINRVRMRLEGLQAYGTLCALMANGCLRLYSSVKMTPSSSSSSNQDEESEETKLEKHQGRFASIALDGFFLSVVLSVLSGSYTTVVFTLLPLYSKTALGRGYDQQFLEFWAATAHIRQTGFTAFLCSLVSFEAAFVLSLYLRLNQSRQKRILMTIASLICIASFWEWNKVMQLASTYLFTLRAEVEY